MSEIQTLDDSPEKPQVVIVKNCFSPTELDLIWKEIDVLQPMLLNASETKSALRDDGYLKKKNKGAFLNEIYGNENPYEKSNIIKAFTKLYSYDMVNTLMNHYTHFNLLTRPINISALLSYYGNGDYYESHKDYSNLTILGYFFREPKSFTGGDFILNDWNISIPIENNMVIYMPSHYSHEVSKVVMEEDNPGFGRYCISQFLTAAN